VLLFPLVAIIWTLVSCYPDPGVFVRNLARYRRLPIDRGIEERMGWELPAESPHAHPGLAALPRALVRADGG
jgi:hypothetical protein